MILWSKKGEKLGKKDLLEYFNIDAAIKTAIETRNRLKC